MKYVQVLLLLMLAGVFPLCALAEDQLQPDKKIVIVEGKKFIPLRGARHFYGTSKPMPVSVNKYVRQPMGHHGLAGPVPKTQGQGDKPAEVNTPAVNNSLTPPPVPLPANTQNTSVPSGTRHNNAASKVLSIFAPEEPSQPPAR